MRSSEGSWQQSISTAFLNRKLSSAKVATGSRDMQIKCGELHEYRLKKSEIQQILYVVCTDCGVVWGFFCGDVLAAFLLT